MVRDEEVGLPFRVDDADLPAVHSDCRSHTSPISGQRSSMVTQDSSKQSRIVSVCCKSSHIREIHVCRAMLYGVEAPTTKLTLSEGLLQYGLGDLLGSPPLLLNDFPLTLSAVFVLLFEGFEPF